MSEPLRRNQQSFGIPSTSERIGSVPALARACSPSLGALPCMRTQLQLRLECENERIQISRIALQKGSTCCIRSAKPVFVAYSRWGIAFAQNRSRAERSFPLCLSGWPNAGWTSQALRQRCYLAEPVPSYAPDWCRSRLTPPMRSCRSDQWSSLWECRLWSWPGSRRRLPGP